ncbi:MAG: hypothetical protein RMA76_41455 [Deltaproteobacteria bacterium]
MTRRIEMRRRRVGDWDGDQVDEIDELQKRQEKHERLTRGRPRKGFGDVLKDRMARARPEEDEEAEETPLPRGAKDPLLGLDPNQDSAIANRPSGKRAGKVIVKG